MESKRQEEEADVRLRKVELHNAIEAIRAQLRQLEDGRETPSPLRESAKDLVARRPGRFKGKLVVGPEFFEPLTDEELRELTGE